MDGSIEERQDSFKIAYIISLIPSETIPLESVLAEVGGRCGRSEEKRYLEEVFADDGLSLKKQT